MGEVLVDLHLQEDFLLHLHQEEVQSLFWNSTLITVEKALTGNHLLLWLLQQLDKIINRYNYETANSITAEEQGEARGDGTKAHGSYSYISPEGEHISITYTADENGFVPQGSHIPTPPPIPEAILKSLQENAAAEARGVYDDGQYRGEGLNEGRYNGEGQGGFQRAAGGFSANGGSAGYAANGGYRY